ncbi:MAG: sigma-70 family RNA polymerase sigma factor [Chloroflexi bacterium]|uniref:Sigma-70 family RNA polymerase sigma factor n=1 Tax=Candidatus Chlorohelix allophototropha TaxID=3003348 RepID=A0A8T7M7A1_9CHLR|nr:sigma-70 family RNA polymerase sigma factor [Chloroflexota bacterium]WJW69787.1 sigma-70 family RNA polymerase sigma factor [Chloroflexota bacterium L227-S17]
MYKLNPDIETAGEYIEEVKGHMSENEPRGRGRPRGSAQNRQPSSDSELVSAYKARAEQFGARSEEAAEAFKPIFERYWNQAYFWALSKIGAVYAEDLAQDTLQTVWERLNGREVVTNLRGLVRHSFEREYATLLEKLLQGRKLQRANRHEEGQEEPSKLKGAVVLSLNVSAPGVEGESAELINLVEDASANVPDSAIRLEQVRVLHDLIEQMPPNYRTPLVYQWLLGKKIKEVADELGLTMDQVKHNTSRGIVWLRKRMPGQAQDWLL